MDEKSLNLQAKQGPGEQRQHAFGQLYELYFEKIYKFIYFRVSHKEVAEDLAEEVFIRAWSKITHVKEDSFGGWLYQIAKNRVIDYYRQKKTDIDIDQIANILESDNDLNRDANAVIEHQVFLGLLKQLSPEQQIIIKLKFLEDLSNAEISELISKSEGSIRVVQHRAIQKLQELFNEQIFNKPKPNILPKPIKGIKPVNLENNAEN